MKKKTVMFAIMASLATPAFAGSTCDSMEELGRTIMTSWQVGVPASTLLNAVPEIEGAEALAEITRNLIMQVVETPQYSLPEYQENAIRQFGDKVYLACVKQIGDR